MANDVGKPMMTAMPNDVWLRQILMTNIASLAKRSEATSYLHRKCIISPKGDASLTLFQIYDIIKNVGAIMKENKLVELSMEFSVDIINLVNFLKSKHETIISNQIGRSGTSVGANIHEAQYAQGNMK